MAVLVNPMTTTRKLNIEGFVLVLPKEILSLNKTMGGREWKTRHFKNARHKEEWRILLRSELNKAKWATKDFVPGGFLLEKKHITITRIMGPRQREFDQDNLVGGCKQLIDAMKGIIIKDDTAKYLDAKYKQIRGERGSTIIKVEFGRGR